MASAETPIAPAAVPLKIGSRDKSVGWYTPTLENVSEAQRDLLENYSHIEPDRVIPHILEIVRYSTFRHHGALKFMTDLE